MYADDSTIYSSQTTIGELQNVLMEELKLVHEWVINNKLALNIGKTKSIVFGTRCMLLAEPKLYLTVKDTNVEQVQGTKLLGVEIDNRLSWSKHISAVVRKMGRSLAMVKRCSHLLPLNMVVDVIKTLVLCQLDYCSEIWSCAAVSYINALQIVQNKAARCALRCPYRTNVNWMHGMLSWLKVRERFEASLLNLTRNIVITKLPNVLYQELCFSSDEHNYETRHATEGRFKLPKVKTNHGKRTVKYRSMSTWNNLPSEIINANGKHQFKVLLKRHLLLLQ